MLLCVTKVPRVFLTSSGAGRVSHTLTIALATAIFTALAFIDVLRANRSLPLFRPSLRHRDEQGAGDVRGEGLWFVTHVAPTKTKMEQDNV
jgi:hypothetical protein